MKRIVFHLSLAGGLLLAFTGGPAMGIEEAAYEVVQTDGAIEIRDVAAYRVAEVTVEGAATEAGNRGFRPLFRYISGANRKQTKIAMTAPVTQAPAGEKIAMTAPVLQAPDPDTETPRWVVGFVMPASYTLETLPVPEDNAIRIREIPARRVAAIRYSGTWSDARYAQHLKQLETWMESQSLPAVAPPVWARYNAPFTPWFMRRNEIWIEIAPPATPTPGDEREAEVLLPARAA